MRSPSEVIASNTMIIPAITNVYFPLNGLGAVTTNAALAHTKLAQQVCLTGFIEMKNPADADDGITTIQLTDSAGADISGWAFIFNITNAADSERLLAGGIIAPVPNFGIKLSQTGIEYRPVMVAYSILS